MERQMLARGRLSQAEYRRQIIMETERGFVVVMNGKQYEPCETFSEATALIDAAFSPVLLDTRAEKRIGSNRAND